MKLIQDGPSLKFDPLIERLDKNTLSQVEVFSERSKDELHIDAKNGQHILVFQDRGWYNFMIAPSLYPHPGIGGHTKMLTLDDAVDLVNKISKVGA